MIHFILSELYKRFNNLTLIFMKKALFTQVNDGVTYERGQVYEDAVVAHLPASDFEDVEAVATTEEVAPVIDTNNAPATTDTITEQDLIDHPEYTVAGLTVGDAKPVDDNKGAGVEVLQ